MGPAPHPLVGIVLVLAGAAFAAWQLVWWSRARASRSWPRAEGVILRAEAKRRRGFGSAAYRVRIEYRYTVGNTIYRSTRIRFGLLRAHADRAQALLARYDQGAHVTVRYDPHEPARAVLEPGATFDDNYAWILLGAIALVIGVVYWVRA
ncbi:MAG: DUF3592 domain-containing protein [Gemmatimonadetes bacterium]|nr:DUF3592 domain-containing protein [Gemmatimonadota bacterium]